MTPRQDQAALLIDQREAPGAQSVVVAVDAEPELLDAAEARAGDQGQLGVVGGLDAVLDPVQVSQKRVCNVPSLRCRVSK